MRSVFFFKHFYGFYILGFFLLMKYEYHTGITSKAIRVVCRQFYLFFMITLWLCEMEGHPCGKVSPLCRSLRYVSKFMFEEFHCTLLQIIICSLYIDMYLSLYDHWITHELNYSVESFSIKAKFSYLFIFLLWLVITWERGTFLTLLRLFLYSFCLEICYNGVRWHRVCCCFKILEILIVY